MTGNGMTGNGLRGNGLRGDLLGAGMITLVGAGPGGADLITVRGAAALAKADVVVFDRLVDPELLELAPASAELVPVGKSKGAGATQEEINDIIVDRALWGLKVVRLKGGDPFVFGRGSEESEAAARARIRCEVVPGLSSALAAPGLAGIPLTHRGIAASFTVLSGHRIEGEDNDWDALARSGSTLVVLMGASTARGIAARLLAGGRPHLEPVALVHNAGRSDQQVAVLTLDRLLLEGCHFPPPVVIVVGQVVTLRDSTNNHANNHANCKPPPPHPRSASPRPTAGGCPSCRTGLGRMGLAEGLGVTEEVR